MDRHKEIWIPGSLRRFCGMPDGLITTIQYPQVMGLVGCLCLHTPMTKPDFNATYENTTRIKPQDTQLLLRYSRRTGVLYTDFSYSPFFDFFFNSIYPWFRYPHKLNLTFTIKTGFFHKDTTRKPLTETLNPFRKTRQRGRQNGRRGC